MAGRWAGAARRNLGRGAAICGGGAIGRTMGRATGGAAIRGAAGRAIAGGAGRATAAGGAAGRPPPGGPRLSGWADAVTLAARKEMPRRIRPLPCRSIVPAPRYHGVPVNRTRKPGNCSPALLPCFRSWIGPRAIAGCVLQSRHDGQISKNLSSLIVKNILLYRIHELVHNSAQPAPP